MNTVVWSRILRLTGDWLSRCFGILLRISIWIFFWSLDLGKESCSSPWNSSLALKIVNFLGLEGTLLTVMRMACNSFFEALGGDGDNDFWRFRWSYGLGDRRWWYREFLGEFDLISTKNLSLWSFSGFFCDLFWFVVTANEGSIQSRSSVRSICLRLEQLTTSKTIKTMAESQEKMDTKPIEEGIDALEFSTGKTMIPNAKKLRDMGQSFTSAIGQLTNFSRSSTIVTSPTTPLSPRTEQMIQSKCT